MFWCCYSSKFERLFWVWKVILLVEKIGTMRNVKYLTVWITQSHLEGILKYSENFLGAWLLENLWLQRVSLCMLCEGDREAGKWKQPWESVTILWVMEEERKKKSREKSQELSMYQQRLSGRLKSENQKVHSRYLLFLPAKNKIWQRQLGLELEKWKLCKRNDWFCSLPFISM